MTYQREIPSKEEIEGLSNSDIMIKYNVSKQTAQSWRRRYGFSLKRRDALPVPPKEELEKLRLSEAAVKYQVSIGTIQNWRRVLGIKGKKWIAKYKIAEQCQAEDRNERMRAVFPYLTDVQISRAFKISRERVRQIRNEMNVDYVWKIEKDGGN